MHITPLLILPTGGGLTLSLPSTGAAYSGICVFHCQSGIFGSLVVGSVFLWKFDIGATWCDYTMSRVPIVRIVVLSQLDGRGARRVFDCRR